MKLIRDFTPFLSALAVVGLFCLFVVFRWGTLAEAAPKMVAEVSQSKCPVHWIIKQDDPMFAAYKNARLVEYQDMLCDRGITGKNDLKLFAAQLLAENGAMSETRLGDHGCSFGLVQYNACAHAGVGAKKFLTLHPEWLSHTFQLRYMADAVAWRYNKYANIQRAITAHNSPLAAAKNRKTPYFGKVSKVASSLTF